MLYNGLNGLNGFLENNSLPKSTNPFNPLNPLYEFSKE
jgi:hypothetical protein